MTYTVTISVDLASNPSTLPGHAYYEISDGVNPPQTYGFYPDSGASDWDMVTGSTVIGDVRTDDNIVRTPDASYTYEITKEQYDALKAGSDLAVSNPPDYDLYDNNCTSFVKEMLWGIGIDLYDTAGNDITPAGMWADIWFDTLSDGFQQMADGWNKFWGEIGGDINRWVNETFFASQAWQAPRDPLAFDLDGDGIETLAENGNAGVLFDHEGNDVKTATGWIAPDDGFLVYDRNGNGVIDNGTELFGDNTALNAGGTAANGFEALADFDTNADGVVDVNDANFAGLRIWQDINSDGISQADELLTLAQAGVASINTGYEDSSIVQNGNVISGLGSYTRTDGTLSSIASATSLVNLDLANSSFYSAFVDSIPVTAEAALLPNMNGSGMVRNMRAAA